MEDGDDDTSLTTDLKLNSEDSVVSENVESKEAFLGEEDLTLPNVSKEAVLCSETVQSEKKEEDISDQSSKTKTDSDTIFGSKLSVYLGDQNCDETVKFSEARSECASELCVSSVSKPDVEVTCVKDSSESFKEPCEVLCSKDEANVVTSLDAGNIVFPSLAEEEKESSVTDENEHVSCYVQNADKVLDTSHENVENCDSSEERSQSEFLEKSNSVNTDEGDSSAEGEINLSDSACNSEVHNGSSSPKDKEISETLDTSSLVNDSFQNDTTSTSSSISQSCMNDSLSQENDELDPEEATKMEVTHDNELDDLEQTSLEEPPSVKEEVTEQQDWESPQIEQQKEELQEQKYDCEQQIKPELEEMETSESVNGDDNDNFPSNISDLDSEIKHDSDVEMSEVKNEWLENEIDKEVGGRGSDEDVLENDTSKNAQNKIYEVEKEESADGRKETSPIEKAMIEDTEEIFEETLKEMSIEEGEEEEEVEEEEEEICDIVEKDIKEDNSKEKPSDSDQYDESQENTKNNSHHSDMSPVEHGGDGMSEDHNLLSISSPDIVSTKESKGAKSEDQDESGKQSQSKDKAVKDNSVKINGEVDLEQRGSDEDDGCTCIREKIVLKRKLQSSPVEEIPSESADNDSCKLNVCFKGLKKRYIAHISEVTTKQVDESQTVSEEIKLRSKRSIKKLVMEPTQVIVSHQQLADRVQSDTPLTEYAQYLGLQPTVKFKCYNCGESGFPSMLKLQEHQNTCLKNVNIQSLNKPPPSPIVEPVPSTNFRITRKVYLCSACGTYYENWNLFLHMREVHKRHICLFCLLMFSQADKLALHLSTKHGIADDEYNSPEEFLSEYDSSFFVMCCTCEQMFTERDNFFDHTCRNVVEPSNDQACSLCGLRGAHFPTCRRAFTDSSAVTSPSHNVQSNVINTESPSSQSTVQDKVSKYSGSTDKSVGRKLHQKQSDKNNSGQNRNPDCDDDYDISDAASYCHVNIDEPDRQKAVNLNSSNSGNEGNSISQINTKQMPDSSDENDKPNVPTISTEISDDVTKEKNSHVTNEERENAYCNSPYEIVTLDEKESTQFSANNEPVHNDIPEKENAKSPSSIHPEPVVFPESQNIKTVDEKMEIPTFSSSKPPKEGDTDSDSSASAAESHGSDDSSSGSEASSDDIETESKEPPEVAKEVVSEESDLDKSDSDKMSIVVDDARSDDEEDKKEIINDCNITANENEVEDTDDSKNNLQIDTKMTGDKCVVSNNDSSEEQQDNIQVAGEDVPLLELTLEETMDMMPIQALVKECVKISCSTCVYCNHAKKIAVNGKQLVLHLLAEHRFEPVVCSDSGELIPVNGFVDNLKGKLIELQDMYFNTDSYDSNDKSFTKPYDRTYECFHCHFITTLHKELYVHNRKMHQKTILLCIMCKSNFYSYSELLCHLCPGIYVPDSNISFRCCLCVVDGLPSAFRLMVHLRKRHHACDVCLETTGDQQKLSNHVWKHKLHHLCYRCGIAYRNKPDITKHLFWKHGTESVLCKKCLQKKWPHVYHFCIPPTAFLCEECNASFTRAVALKVHKRLHVGDIAYECDECQEKFISKKLLRRHKDKHKLDVESENQNLEQIKESKICDVEPDNSVVNKVSIDISRVDVDVGSKEDEEILPENTSHMGNSSKGSEASDEVHNQTSENTITKTSEETKCKKSKVVDVYDLPPLNLSSESDDSEDESVNKKLPEDTETKEEVNILSDTATEIIPPRISQGESQMEEEAQPVEIVDGVWDNFKNYKANLEKREILQAQVTGSLVTNEIVTSLPSSSIDCHAMMDIILADHDYCIVPEKPKEKDPESLTHDESLKKTITTGLGDSENPDDKGDTFGADHNYCYNTSPTPDERKESSECILQTSGPVASQSPPLQLTNQNHPISISTPNSSPKKKQKSPKKKQRQSGSSSSSDSSSNSDSSSCTCGTNCSCSSSSSSSSGSSSSSSDSDSSSSEGRRRQAIRRERRRERAKRKLDSESRGGTPPVTALPVPATVSEGNNLSVAVTPMQIDSGGGLLQVDDGPPAVVAEPEENEFLIRESDLDTTETETDEDFYDKYPQRQANKLLAEKRNQLLLLAAVAPVNNGTLTQPNSPPPAPVEESTEPVQKKKGRNKRHKKAQHSVSEKKLENKLKLNIPITYYNNPSFSGSNSIHPVSPVINSQNVVPSHASRIHEAFSPVPEASSTPSAYHSTGSGSETESKRLSKRKRIPKKFYGDSSDEEAEHTPHLPYKWRKVIPNNNSNPPAPPPPPPPSASSQSVSNIFSFRSVNVPAPEQVQLMPPQTKSDDGDDSESGQEAKRSSSDSSNSDSDNEHSDGDSDVETVASVTNTLSSVSGNVNQQKNENLYCYCQCPYDEVSEMIACDGKDCSIEWFHFECVGIMVPPKGKWFCPDCRKKTAARSEYLLHA